MSPRPGRIAETIDIDLPHPRDDATREQDRYFELVTEVREALRGRPVMGRRRCATGRGRARPDAAARPDLAARSRADGAFG